jgi:hypothetical protein
VIESPPSDIGPCDDQFSGRLLQDFCRDCGHALATHRHDHVCSVCEAVADLRATVNLLYQEVQDLKER